MTEIREGTEADARVAAALHGSEIREGFLPTLGTPFLTRLYRRVVRSPQSFLLVAVDDGRTVGFIAGTENVRALYRTFLLHDGIAAGVAALPQVLRSWRRVLETLRYPGGGSKGEAAPAVALPEAELLAVAVGAAGRGLGTGRALVEAFTHELSRRGVIGARVVVGTDNESAIRLYERCGFTKVRGIEVHEGTASQVLTWP